METRTQGNSKGDSKVAGGPNYILTSNGLGAAKLGLASGAVGSCFGSAFSIS